MGKPCATVFMSPTPEFNIMGVRTRPGDTALIRMARGAYSSAASYAMSGIPRKVKPTGVVPTIWAGLSQYGEYSNCERPPPPDCHADSPRYVPSTLTACTADWN